ncbi:hypothetical protein CANARDRAFT_194072 [[Candida] arabinofermentans NRRL YB-2248]|uniref:Transcription factor domain-containing protein n=1 Tax=[Candida] arabinofermentans NRRL YB-2248 TaxID=983967 RepID=A0A1E4T6I1_9ASCO|nr:hypothetical protein CANARDRAFT_194072 [[Candida] arabinofermentans NRRL YB-2248]
MQLYTFYTESTLKLHYHMVNTLPYRVCRDPINRNLLMKGLQYCPLYDYLWHAFMAVNCIDLYYQKETCGIDDVLNLSKDAYLNMGDYHMTRSMLSLAEEVKKQEDAKKAVSLVLTTMLHIFYATGSPNQMIADRAYFGLGKNLGLLFTEYAVMFSKCTIFNQACARYCINEWSEDAINYFPEFLYGLIDVEYEDTNEPNEPNNKQKVKPLSNDCKIMLKTMVDRLKREFRSFANPTIYRNPIMSSRYVPIDSLLNKDDDLSNDDGLNNNVKKLEYDMYGTMSRYIVEIPDLFIEMQEMNDPRALLITAYNVISLVSRRYEYWPISVYRRELDYIKSLLTKLENENLWIRWMDVAYNVLDGLENETTSH